MRLPTYVPRRRRPSFHRATWRRRRNPLTLLQAGSRRHQDQLPNSTFGARIILGLQRIPGRAFSLEKQGISAVFGDAPPGRKTYPYFYTPRDARWGRRAAMKGGMTGEKNARTVVKRPSC